MIQITYTKADETKVSILPMPPSGGLFSDSTVPNSPATSACLVRAAQCLRSNGESVDVPQLTEAEMTTSKAAQLTDKANWGDMIPEATTDEESQARRDEIRGYSEADVIKYMKDNSSEAIEADALKGIEAQEAVVVTEEQAREALHKVEMNEITMISESVVVPNDTTLKASILTEKENNIASNRVNSLINSGHLVTDLSIEDYTAWKAQFTVTEIEE